MRSDPIQFALANEATSKIPRYVCTILFDTGSLYCTSHSDIPNVPGIVLQSVLKSPSAISQRIVPDEGRSEIGSFSFSLVDLAGVFTDAIRTKLAAGKGLRGKTVQFWCGFEGFDFTAFPLFQTQIVVDADLEGGVYTVHCADITRAQRKDICEPKFTTLRDNVSDTAATIPVYDTSAFAMVVHGTSWSDAPNSTVGYIQIQGEKIRYTGKTPDSFTGCTRGALNTKAVAHSVDANAAADRRTKVSELIYLELPAVKLAWAINTGILYGSANTLPAHWHLGIDPSFLRASDFTGIGLDLWDSADDAAALILRFEGLKKTDGKRFLEKEIYLLLGCYSPVYSDGTMGLRRLPALLGDSAPAVTLTERELISLGALQHDLSGMHNNLRVNWNYDPAKEEFTRITPFVDLPSRAIHGTASIQEYSFKGLFGSRHTDAIVIQRLHALRDAYAYPPQRTNATVPGSLSRIEMGDVVRLKPASVRDFAGAGSLDRAFLVLNKVHRAASNQVALELFGSTARPLATTPGTGVATPLPDSFYTAAGTNLNTIAAITANVMATGNFTITGNASLTNAGAIFYHNGDLTIPNGCNLTIAANVQLRIRGFLTLNGTINGVGGGKAGVADPGTGSWDATFAGNPGFVGNSRGWDGLQTLVFGHTQTRVATIPVPLTEASEKNGFAQRMLAVSGNSLLGLPTDLRGTGGGPGGRVVGTVGGSSTILAPGVAGAAGGAGLCIICRGMSPGAAANITLSGANPATPVAASNKAYPGAGGPGGPGAMLILLDGNSLSVPDITGKFFAVTGTITQPGVPLTQRTGLPYNPPPPFPLYPETSAGYADPSVVSALDMSNAAHRIQYVPETQTVAPDVDVRPPAPTALSIAARGEFIQATVTSTLGALDENELWASLDNNRVNAVLVDHGRTAGLTHELPVLTTRYFWSRVGRIFADRPAVYSDWFPAGATSGIQGTTLNPNGWTPATTAAGGATMVVSANQIQKSGGIGAWDSQVYSRESYAAGCAVSFRPLQTNADFGIGLNTDPVTDANYTSIDFWINCAASGAIVIYENGVGAGSFGAYDTSTVLAITYDGAYVRYLKNGAEIRKVPRIGERFYLDSSWYTPGAAAAAIQFVPLTPAPNTIALVARGNCVTQGDAIQKVGGVAAWDSDCYSLEAYSGGCVVKFRPAQTNAALMIGLNSDPTTDQNFTSIDFGWYLVDDGRLFYSESGTQAQVDPAPGYTTNTVLSITYDGQVVRYYKDGVLRREVAAPGKVFFLDSSFYSPGGIATDVSFGALNSSPTQRLIARGNCIVVGNSLQKQGGVNAWDSDCYSAESFTGGCVVSWKVPATTVGDFMIGLNSDPLTDQNYTSLDYSTEVFYFAGAWNYRMYESSTPIGAGASVAAAGDVFAIKYDGAWIRYYKNGSLLREVPDPGKTFFLDSSFFTPGSIALDVNFGPLTTATPSPFIARGNCKVSDTNVIKQGGVGAWDSDCYSIVGYPVCHVSFKPNQVNADLMVGLGTQPTLDQNFTSINYAFHVRNDGLLDIRESGTLIGSFGAYTTGTVLALTYDGATVTYWKNNVSVRTVAVAGLQLFMDSSFSAPGGGINSLRFGPTTNLALTDTAQIGPGAATDVLTATANSTTITALLFTPDGFARNNTVLSIAYTAPFDAEIEMTASFTIDYTTTAALGYLAQTKQSIQDGTWDDAKRQEFFMKGDATHTSFRQTVTVARRFAATAGVAVTYGLYMAKLDAADTCTVTNAQMKLVSVKR